MDLDSLSTECPTTYGGIQATCNRSQIKRFNTDQTSISNPTIIPKGAISAVLCYGGKGGLGANVDF